MLSFLISFLFLKPVNGQGVQTQIFIPFLDWSESLEPVEVIDVRNDRIDIHWRVPEEFLNATTKQRLVVAIMKEQELQKRHPKSFHVEGHLRDYTFINLQGNTSYRVSVEAFSHDGTSLWYGSNVAKTSLAALNWLPPPMELMVIAKGNDSLEISWAPPDISTGQHHVAINQYFINVYEFYPESQTFTKKFTTNIPIPKTSFLATRLNPGNVYNITIQAGTTFGYGSTAWIATNTLAVGDSYIIKQKIRTPNSIIVAWPSAWMGAPNAKFSIRAKTLHSNEGIEKEILETGFVEAGRSSEFLLKHLSPGSTYNVTLMTAAENEKAARVKWGKASKIKSTWAVFSTLVQGEYSIAEARVASESDLAASIVFQPLNVVANVIYQLRYTPIDQTSDDPIIETRELRDDDLRCPKFGCEWKCFLFFNLKRRPRDYTFAVRAKVDGVWNKWSPVQRRQWNLLERPCSINPPSSFVDHIGNGEHQRILDLKSAKKPDDLQDVWRFLVVIDSRQSNIATMDLTKLADKATADFDHIPYYITASLTPEEVDTVEEFRLGDGKVHGGYLNYPLDDASFNPQYTLIPMSQQENEIMEPRLRSCGFTEQGIFECDMGMFEVLSYIPDWAKAALALMIALLVAFCCLGALCCVWKSRKNQGKTRESSLLYYRSSSPHHSVATHEYRRVEQRDFSLADTESRRLFRLADYAEEKL